MKFVTTFNILRNKLYWKGQNIFKFLNLHKKVSISYIIIFFVVLILLGGQAEFFNNKLKQEIKEHKHTKAKLSIAIKLKEKAETVNRVALSAVNVKVDALYNFTKKFYPGFDYNYKKEIDEAIKEGSPEKIENLPEDLLSVYVKNYYLEQHGLKNYENAFPELIYPMDPEISWVSCKAEEFGTWRPYNYTYYNKHLGLGIKSWSTNAVKAICNMTIWNKYYSEESGWIIEAKAKIKDAEGKTKHLFIRYMHLVDINEYVRKGQKVKQSDVIASMGRTGYLSTGIHLHYEVWIWNGKQYIPHNPVKKSTYGNAYIAKINPRKNDTKKFSTQ